VKIERLDIPDAWLCTPIVHADSRGLFLEWFRGDQLAEESGRRFHVVQANHSESRRGVVRGLHFADVPPGQAKFVYCTDGAVLDVLVDVRVGSPTYGSFAAVELDAERRRGVLVAEGLAHGFCVLSESATVVYLLSHPYDPATEHGISPTRSGVDLGWPLDEASMILSAKDQEAPTLEEARLAGLLPSYTDCVAVYAAQRAE
jgi:dTDP-4-dehydrorhamnose 3,5-epimerase